MENLFQASLFSVKPGKYFANEGLYQCNALKFANDTTSSFGNSFTANDIIGIAVDYDNGAVYVYDNGAVYVSKWNLSKQRKPCKWFI